MRTLRILFGAVIDLTIFGISLPWLTIATGRLLDRIFFPSARLDGPFFDLLGAALLLAGAAWLGWAWLLLVRDGRGHITELFGLNISPVTERLVTRGPFAVHRHPICLGYLAILAGIALMLGIFSALAVVIPLLLGLTHVYLRRFEEPCLLARFAGDYRAYASRVPMFWPKRRGN